MSNLKTKLFGDYSKKEIKKITHIKDKILELESKYSKMAESELKNQTILLKERLSNGETLDDILPEAFATCREAAYRTLGMKHFPVQILGGIILHQGRIAEMRTGEGKTLVATLPVYLNALSSNGVHVVTVNDYLAKRDSEWMGKIYKYLGLTVGLITHNMSKSERAKAYLCDITYATNNEIGFDYLKDNMVTHINEKVQRKFNFAIIDEIDSILIDEARTPLIISGKGDDSTKLYSDVNLFVKTLTMEKVANIDSKETTEDIYSGDFIVDEKAKSTTLTQSGIKKAEKYFNIDNLMDVKYNSLRHHIEQSLKAVGVMQRDINYIVKDGKILIVDEFTGRIMDGRRYSNGLHQAIEAKEGVEIQNENKTLATITFQNLFKLYNKLSGMTGTAETEANEFREIYNLDVVTIPTNKEIKRIDLPDIVYMSEKAKFNNVVEKIIECYQKQQPVLVGTVDIEKSELLSKLLKKRKIPHKVLNAKNHEKEAEIIAQAGRLGAVTIATNMAGRGTDIILGGNPEALAIETMRKFGFSDEDIIEATSPTITTDKDIIETRMIYRDHLRSFEQITSKEADMVRKLGGLYVIGTERHESRRIDNQLRGRAGRQGDPGITQFYLSLEDNLLRLFGGERIQNFVDKLIENENSPIESKLVSRSIENSQKNIEGIHFSARKNVLQYDNIMAEQRKVIYKQRDEILAGNNITDKILKMVTSSIGKNVYLYCPEKTNLSEWDLTGLKTKLSSWNMSLIDIFNEDISSQEDIINALNSKAKEIILYKKTCLGPSLYNEIEKTILLNNIDTYWMDYIDEMNNLKQSIGLQAYAQHDPVVAFRMESYDMFSNMSSIIKEETSKMILNFIVNITNE